MSGPLVSVVIPAWNREATIERAVRSVLDQQGDVRIEVVVVDNGSGDATVERVRAIGDDRVRLVVLDENRGPSGGRNAGAAAATGDLLGFLDSDDELDPTWAAALAGALADPSAAVATCGFRFPDGGYNLPDPKGPAFYDASAQFQAGTMLFRTDAFRAIGGYADVLWVGENTELGLRATRWCAENGRGVVAVREPLLLWHRHQGEGRRYTDSRKRFGAEYTIEQHHEQLARDPRLLAGNHATAGAGAARQGDWAAARRHFWTAFTLDRRPRNLGRYLSVANPVTRRRAWPPRGRESM